MSSTLNPVAVPDVNWLGPDGTGGVCLVPAHPARPGSWPAPAGAGHAQVAYQHREHRRVPRLARSDQDHEWQAAACPEMVDLGAQFATGAPDAVVTGFGKQIPVVRQVPLWHGQGSCRAGGHG